MAGSVVGQPLAPKEPPRRYTGIDAGFDAYDRFEAKRRADIGAQARLNDDLLWLRAPGPFDFSRWPVSPLFYDRWWDTQPDGIAADGDIGENAEENFEEDIDNVDENLDENADRQAEPLPAPPRVPNVRVRERPAPRDAAADLPNAAEPFDDGSREF